MACGFVATPTKRYTDAHNIGAGCGMHTRYGCAVVTGLKEPWGGGGGWHEATVLVCVPLAAPIDPSSLYIPTLCGSERVLVVSLGGGGGAADFSTHSEMDVGLNSSFFCSCSRHKCRQGAQAQCSNSAKATPFLHMLCGSLWSPSKLLPLGYGLD